jgi:hypothetical protein
MDENHLKNMPLFPRYVLIVFFILFVVTSLVGCFWAVESAINKINLGDVGRYQLFAPANFPCVYILDTKTSRLFMRGTLDELGDVASSKVMYFDLGTVNETITIEKTVWRK